jgi:hypothetical protein
LVHTLSDLRLTAALNTLTRYDKKMADEVVERRRPSLPFSFSVASLDNIDFTRKGSNAGKESYTGLTFYEHTQEVLKADGFYESDPTKRIRRRMRTLAAFVEEEESNGRNPARH